VPSSLRPAGAARSKGPAPDPPPDTTDYQVQRTEELRPWFHDMYQFQFGRQPQVVHRPCGIVELKPSQG
jgi:hypothetical protein